MAEFPSELLAVPQPLIGFYGLDLNDSIHKAILESFTNRTERPSIQYKIIPSNYEFPTKKPKRTAYDWYNPKHILKKNWILKYLHVIPSLVVVFVDLEWKDPQWSEKQLNCSTLIQQLKSRLQERFTRIAIVLLQKSAQTLTNDDLIATERSSTLANICEINAKQLFVLPFNDQHLLGYTIRLESAFLELSQSFYIQLLKQYRVHRDQTSASHQTLKVRHQFKMGFISETRLDFPTALKHYTQSYANLEDIRIVDTNCLEIKTVAGFINYKMCKLMFKLNLPRDSITQFKTHVEKYKMRTGFKELLFEHYAWLSLQFNFFAELFIEAVKGGLTALQTQHPGIYYHKAVEYMYKRRETFIQTNAFTPTSPVPGQLSALYSDYFGVRNGTKNSETGTDQQIISLVQEMEAKFNYSNAIINLLGQAMSQFKIYRCGRFRKKLAIEMAEEYFRSGEHTKALTLYSLMLSDYRQDKWFTIFSEILVKTLQSATLAASVNDFVACSIESLSPSIKIGKLERQNILENLWKVFNNVPPTFHNQIAPEIKNNWESSLMNYRSPVTVDLDDVPGLIDCKISFQNSQIKFTEMVAIDMYLRSNAEVPIKVKTIAVVLLSNAGTNYRLLAIKGAEYQFNASTKEEKTLNDFKAEDFLLESGKCFKFELTASQNQFSENLEIGINRIEITMGTDKNFAMLTIQKSLNVFRHFQHHDIHSDHLEHIKVIKTCYVVPTFHIIAHTIQDSQPMLVNEYYQIKTNLVNIHDGTLHDVGISINLPTSLRNKVFLATEPFGDATKLSSFIEMTIGEMEGKSSTASLSYFIVSMVEGNIELKQSLWYQMEDKTAIIKNTEMFQPNADSSPIKGPDIAKTFEKYFIDKDENHDIMVEYLSDNLVKKKRDDIIIVPCVEEFSFESKFYTLDRQPLTSCYRNEDFVMRLMLHMKSPLNLDIVDAFLISDVNIDEQLSDNRKLIKNGISRGSKFENLLILRPTRTTKCWLTKENYQRKTSIDASHLFDIECADVKLKHLCVETCGTANVSDSEDPFSLKSKDQKLKYVNSSNDDKKIINNSLDVTELVDSSGKRKGFINATVNIVNDKDASLDTSNYFGIYCIRWKKPDSDSVNESKFVISGIDVIEPLLNIYCTIDERLYVREIFTLRVLLKNPHNSILHLVATLTNADGFMFAGHRQLNITIFSHSQFELTFNLYPLKSNFQRLPELKLEMKNYVDEAPLKDNLTDDAVQNAEINQKQLEINELLKRWMPKRVFVHPPTRKISKPE